MEYKFSAAWFVAGMLIVIIGSLFMRYHQWVADNFGGGVGSYERYKLVALITIIVGLVSSINLHTVLLSWFFNLLFGGLSNS
jgi:hypothetical protein